MIFLKIFLSGEEEGSGQLNMEFRRGLRSTGRCDLVWVPDSFIFVNVDVLSESCDIISSSGGSTV